MTQLFNLFPLQSLIFFKGVLIVCMLDQIKVSGVLSYDYAHVSREHLRKFGK